MATLDNYIQGYFTADGNAHILSIRSDVDYIEVENLTKSTTPVNGTGVRFRWQRGMPQGYAIQDATNGAGAITTTVLTSNGITLINTADPQTPSALLTGTTITNAAPPVASSAGTGSLANGNIVEVINSTGAPQLNGYQFTVDTVVANTSFNLAYMIAPGNATTAFTYRFFQFNPMFYPRRRLITNITRATQAVVTLSVTHGYTVGQYMVFNIPTQFGMTQLNGLRGKIVAINTTTNTITVDIDTSAFTAWTFPTATVAAAPFTPAQVIPFGDGLDVSQPLQTSATLAGATQNTAILGVALGAGANGPAGIASDQIFWRAWKASQLQTTYYA